LISVDFNSSLISVKKLSLVMALFRETRSFDNQVYEESN